MPSHRTEAIISPGELARYRAPSLGRSLLELSVTAVPLVVLWALMWVSLSVGYWFTLILAVAAAAFLMHLFMTQHDCGHGACFSSRLRMIGLVEAWAW